MHFPVALIYYKVLEELLLLFILLQCGIGRDRYGFQKRYICSSVKLDQCLWILYQLNGSLNVFAFHIYIEDNAGPRSYSGSESRMHPAGVISLRHGGRQQ